MKTILNITIIIGILVLIYWYYKKKAPIKDSLGSSYEEKLATVIQVIYKTPSWMAYIQDHADKKGEDLNVPLMHSARYDLDRRGLEDIIENPEDFLKCFG